MPTAGNSDTAGKTAHGFFFVNGVWLALNVSRNIMVKPVIRREIIVGVRRSLVPWSRQYFCYRKELCNC